MSKINKTVKIENLIFERIFRNHEITKKRTILAVRDYKKLENLRISAVRELSQPFAAVRSGSPPFEYD
jgi:hypothetical protein